MINMDATLSNFIITIVGIGIGAIVSLIGALSKCMLKSRCTTIKLCGAECQRVVIDENNEVYHDSQSPKL